MKVIDYQRFKELLHTKKDILESNIIHLKDEVESIMAESEVLDSADEAFLETDNNSSRALLKHQQRELSEVEHALMKIKNGTYGICEKNGEAISIERLQAEPASRYCLKDAKKA